MTTEACWGYAAFFLATGSSMMPMISDSFMIRSSWPSIFGAGPFAEQHPVTDLHIDGDELAGLVTATGTDGNHLAL